MNDAANTKLDFKKRVKNWAQQLDVSYGSIVLRPMRTKWASCSTSGRLTFDVELLDLEEDLQDYVIVHELLHFSVPNHGRLWKSLMRAYLGDFEELEARLEKVASVHFVAGD